MNLSIATVKQTAVDSIAIPLECVRSLNEAVRRLPAGGGNGPDWTALLVDLKTPPPSGWRSFFTGRRLRATAAASLGVFLYSLVVSTGELSAQPFRDFDQVSRDDLQRFGDRAERLNDVDAWNNYMTLGVATERADWEEEAYDQLRKELDAIEERTDLSEEQRETERSLAEERLNTAALAWQADAEDFIYEQRGSFRARSADLGVDELTDQAAAESLYNQALAQAEAALAAEAALDLNTWDTLVNTALSTFRDAFDDALEARLDTARTSAGALPAEEAAEFEAELDRRAAEIRSEFTLRDSFYVKRARNNYVALKRADDLSARLFADQQSAEAFSNQVIEEAAAETDALADEAVAAAESETEAELAAPDAAAIIDEIAGGWQDKMEAVITAGLDRWDRAEEELYKRQLEWMQANQSNRAAGERIWEEQRAKLKEKREAWLKEVEAKIAAGRTQWQTKFAEFADSRAAAEQELADFTATERARRASQLGQINDLVRGGGAALAEARDAYRYFTQMAAATRNSTLPGDAQLNAFYESQRTTLDTSIGSFLLLLNDADSALYSGMDSTDPWNGLLLDRRAYAGDLPQETAALDRDNFRAELVDLMGRVEYGEDFTLYRRDLEALIDANAIFSERARELDSGPAYEYESRSTIEELRTLTAGLDSRFADHKAELFTILNKDRDAALSDEDKLAAIKTDITAWFALSNNENHRLKDQVARYFSEGLGDRINGGDATGYYVSGNASDPYLMTEAELQWELLRRERNYFAKRLRRAEEVKRYADLARQYDARTEMAQATEERAYFAGLQSKVQELIYLALKGDLNIDPGARTNPVTLETELVRVLGTREVDLAAYGERRARITAERALLASVPTGARPGTAELDALALNFRNYLGTYVPDVSAQASHRVKLLLNRLDELRAASAAGADAATLDARWTSFRATLGGVEGELDALYAEFDFAGFDASVNELRTQLTAATLPELLANMQSQEQVVRDRAQELSTARAALDVARAEYNRAYLDWRLIGSPEKAQLAEAELLQATQALSGAVNRMEKIENAPQFAGRVFTPAEKARYEYIDVVSRGEAASERSLRATDAVKALQGLEAAKARRASLNGFLTANTNFDGASAVTLADAIINNQNNLVTRSAGEAHLNSHGLAVQALDRIISARTAHTNKATELSDALADPDATLAERARLRGQLSQLEEELRTASESLFAAIRAEEEARREGTHRLLDTRAADNSARTNLKTFIETLEDDAKALRERKNDLNQAAFGALGDFLNANRAVEYGELLQRLNDAIDAAPRSLRTSSAGFTYPDETAPTERAALELARRWLLANRVAIDNANEAPDASDRRSVAEKWDGLLDYLGDLEDDSDYYAEYLTSVPDSYNDARVQSYEDARTELLNRLNTALASSDGSLATTYAALAASDRETLESYGPVAGEGALLRKSLEALRTALSIELASLPAQFKEIYKRELSLQKGRELAQLERELGPLAADLAAWKAEDRALAADETRLTDEIAAASGAWQTTLQGRLADVQARRAELATRIAAQTPLVESKSDQRRALVNLLRELSQEGSSTAYLAGADDQFEQERASLTLRSFAVQLMQQADLETGKNLPQQLSRVQVEDRIKAAIGLYETEANGKIKRDESGQPIVSEEFATELGVSDPNVSLATLLGGNQRGSSLKKIADRLIEWRSDPARAREIPAEVGAAIELLESEIFRVLAAQALIERRDATPTEVRNEAIAMRNNAEQLLAKAARARELERKLQEAIQNAEQNGIDPIAAALAVLENKETANLFFLFDGYNDQLAVDGVRDDEALARMRELRSTADRLRRLERERTLTAVAQAYAEYGANYIAYAGANPEARGIERSDFLDAYESLRPGELRTDIAALSDTNFRNALWTRLNENNAEERLYKSEIAGLLTRDARDGAALKAAVLAAIDGLETQFNDYLNVELDAADYVIERDRDLEITTSVTDLITNYATRADTARTALATDLAGIVDGEDIAAARTRLRSAITSKLAGAHYGSLRRALEDLATAATSAEQLRTSLNDRLNAETNPTAATLAKLEEDLYNRELKLAITVSDNSAEYDPDDYPAELRRFVLLRAYTKARERYDEYLREVAKDAELGTESASLNLAGLLGELAQSVLQEDFDSYRSANDYTAKIAAQEGRYSVAEYVAEYLNERRTGGAALPNGGAQLYVDIAQREYQRIQADATGAGGLEKLNEASYLAEFAEYLFLAKVKEHRTRTAYTVSGATEADRRAHYRASFEAMLDDATYTVAGKTLRQRLLSGDAIERYFEVAYADLVEGQPPLDQRLPIYLDELRIAGELNNAPKTAAAYLPDELTAMADYATADYRAEAASVNARYAQALARLESQAQYQEDLALGHIAPTGLGLYLSDGELDGVIERAGHASLDAAAKLAIREELRGRTTSLYASTASEGALRLLRGDNALRTYYSSDASQAALEAFYAAEGEHLVKIEAKYFANLEQQHDQLRTLAKHNRGQLIRAIIARGEGEPSAYYDSQSAAMQGYIDQLATALYSGGGVNALSDEEKTSLRENAADYGQSFQLRSAQELIASGIFEALEQALNAAVERSDDEALRTRYAENATAASRALAERLFNQRGVQSGYSAQASAQLSDAAMAAAIDRAIEELTPAEAKLFVQEKVLISRFYEQFAEQDSERAELQRVLGDAATTDRDATLSIYYRTSIQSANNQQARAKSADAFLKILSQNAEYYKKREREERRNYAIAQELEKFANVKGERADYLDYEYTNYRTYLGMAEGVQQASTDRYNANNGADPDLTRVQYYQGQIVLTEAIQNGDPAALLSGDYDAVLTSDQAGAAAETYVTNTHTADPNDDVTIEVHRVRTAYDASGLSGTAALRAAYYASLANNYVDAVSRLNRALSAVWDAGQLAETREAANLDEMRESIRTSYDVEASDARDVSVAVNLRQQAEADKAANGQSEIQLKQGAIDAANGAEDEAARKFGDAGRRKALADTQSAEYVQSVFEGVRTNYEAARLLYEDANNRVNTEQTAYDTRQQAYVGALDSLAEHYRDFQKSNEVAETRQAVLDYASTPYLNAADLEDDETLTPEERERRAAGDAQEEYELALAAYNSAQQRLKDAGYEVQIQDNLEEFAAIIAELEDPAGERYPALTTEERERLNELREKKYRDFETLDATEEADLQKLNRQELYDKYKDVIAARAEHIKHTMRLTRIAKATTIINRDIEIKRKEMEQAKQAYEKSMDRLGTMHPADPRYGAFVESREVVYRRLISARDSGRPASEEFRAWYWLGGRVALDWWDDSARNLIYSLRPAPVGPAQQLEMLGALNAMAGVPGDTQYHVDRWLVLGGQLAEFNNFKSRYFEYYMTAAWFDQAVWTASLAVAAFGPLLAVPIVNIAAQAKIAAAQIQVLFAAIATWWTASAALQSAHYTTVNQIQAKEQDYITKRNAYNELAIVPDVQAVKARLIDYGQRQRDPDSGGHNYYTLTEEDLDYLFETTGAGAQWKKSNGTTYTPTAEQAFNGLDAAATRNPDGTYDLASVTRAMQDHAANLRLQKLANYMNAGAAADGGVFTLKERERTFRKLYQDSQDRTHGGQEYAGYLTTFDDYIANQQALYDIELNQKIAQQQKEWQLREQELNDAYNSWEGRMAKIVERGQKSWSNAENKFLQSWRNWERDYDRAIADGNAAFEVKKQEHFAARQQWESEVRSSAAEANITETLSAAVDRMNQMIAGLNTGSNSDLALIDKQSAINAAVAQLALDEPGEADKLANVNQSIQNFNTNLGISEIRSISLGDKMETLRKRFYDASQAHQKDMQVYSNTKLFEQYRLMQKDLIAEIEEMNRQKREETHGAATAAGYQLEAGIYVKKGGIPAGLEDALAQYSRYASLLDIGAGEAVNPYTDYDATAGVDRVFSALGAVSLGNVDEMVQNLTKMDGVEMQAFMDFQMLLFDRGYKKLFGEGSGDERKNSAPDERIFGDVGLWIGRAPDGEKIWQMNWISQGQFAGYEGARAAITQTASGGFGELGAATLRPSGDVPGFYVQLALTEARLQEIRNKEAQYMASKEGAKALISPRAYAEGMFGHQHVGDSMQAMDDRLRMSQHNKDQINSRLSADQRAKADEVFRKAGVDGGMEGFLNAPVSGLESMMDNVVEQAIGPNRDLVAGMNVASNILNMFNPAWTYSNGLYNVETAHRTQLDRSKGYMWEAQYISLLKPAVIVLGAVLVVVGIIVATVGNAVFPGGAVGVGSAIIAAGSALIVAGQSTQVNTQTGERGMQLTEQAAINSALTIGTAVAGGLGAAGAAAGSAGASAGAGAGTGAGAGGLSMGQTFALGAQTYFGGSGNEWLTAGQMLAGGIKYDERGRVHGYDLGQLGLNIGINAAGAGMAEGLGASGVAGGAINQGTQQALTALIEYGRYQRGERNNWAAYERGDPGLLGQNIVSGFGLAVEGGLFGAPLSSPAQNNAQNALLGAGYMAGRRPEDGGFLDGFFDGAAGALGFAEGGLWEKAKNLFSKDHEGAFGIWETNAIRKERAAAFERMERQIGADERASIAAALRAAVTVADKDYIGTRSNANLDQGEIGSSQRQGIALQREIDAALANAAEGGLSYREVLEVAQRYGVSEDILTSPATRQNMQYLARQDQRYAEGLQWLAAQDKAVSADGLLGVLLADTARAQATLDRMDTLAAARANNPLTGLYDAYHRSSFGRFMSQSREQMKSALSQSPWTSWLYDDREMNHAADYHAIAKAVREGRLPQAAMDAWRSQQVAQNADLANAQLFVGGASPIGGLAGGGKIAAESLTKVAGTRGLVHSFDRHAAQWFGREVSSATHLRQWQAIIERTLRSSKQVPWSTGADETIGYLARVGGRNFFVQVYTAGERAGEVATAFVLRQKQLTAVLNLLK